MTIEFKKTDEGISFLINGEEVSFFIKNTDYSYTLRNDFELDNDEIDELLKLEYSEIPLGFEYYKEDYFEINGASIDLSIAENHLGLCVKYDLEVWANNYPFKDFNLVLEGILSEGPFSILNYNNFQIDVDLDLDNLEYKNQSMLANVKKALDFIEESSVEAHKFLTEKTRDDVFIKVFEFPPEYKNICSQYLIWFGEFLQNLGIDANVSTNHSKNQTQLIVSPNECPELISDIEKLFYQYLSLPYAELLPPEPNSSQSEMLSFQSLTMQVQHLQTQIQMKDAVISSYQITNKALSDQNSELLLINSLKSDEKAEFFNGFLKVSRIQKIGKNGNVEVDLSPILKLLKK